MYSKTLLLVLLGVALSFAYPRGGGHGGHGGRGGFAGGRSGGYVAAYSGGYNEYCRNQDHITIRSYFTQTSPAELTVAWDNLLGQVLLALYRGREQALMQVSGNGRWQVIQEWDAIQTSIFNNQYEVRRVIDAFRADALSRAPTQWNDLAQLTIQYWDSFMNAAYSGNIVEVRQAYNSIQVGVSQAYSQFQVTIRA